MSDEQRMKANCRRTTRHLIARAKLEKGRCVREGASCAGRVEPHHTDYTNPRLVEWACRGHHLAIEAELRRAREPGLPLEGAVA